MRKVSGSKPDGVQDKRRKKKRKKPGQYGGEKEGGKGDREVENRRKDSARCSAREREIKSSFIHTVSSNYQCIYSIPWGVAIVF